MKELDDKLITSGSKGHSFFDTCMNSGTRTALPYELVKGIQDYVCMCAYSSGNLVNVITADVLSHDVDSKDYCRYQVAVHDGI